MQLEVFGVRGSVPAPGADTAKYGGNTSCVYVVSDEGTHVILDSGTGIIKLGDQLIHSHDVRDDKKVLNILLTHNHWDHIQGFPFFKPIYVPDWPINIYPGQVDTDDKDAILQQMTDSTFPVPYSMLLSDISIDTKMTSREVFEIDDVTVYTKPLNHPGGGTAYLLETATAKLAYVTDNEINPPARLNTSKEQWIDFYQGVDLLIHDAQFINEEMPGKLGWGHSTVDQVAELAIASNVKRLALISHDPSRTDEQLDNIECYMNKKYGEKIAIFCAAEGQKFEL
jgi:phosphoribosyl 1,2-cyclic phosphodiesterase